MQIGEVCRACGLTRKAVDYYEKQGLVVLKYKENGYREFSMREVTRLRKISLLRGFGLAISEIREVLETEGEDHRQVLERCRDRLDREARQLQERLAAFDEWFEQDWMSVQSQDAARIRLERSADARELLRQAFPGSFGDYADLHFGRWLEIDIVSDEQRYAYEGIVEFLENVDEQKVLAGSLDQLLRGSEELDLKSLEESVHEAVKRPEKLLEAHRESVEWYLAYRQTEEYRSGSAALAMKAFGQFAHQNGYEEVFLRNLEILNPAYHEYRERLKRANAELLLAYPEAGRLSREESETDS